MNWGDRFMAFISAAMFLAFFFLSLVWLTGCATESAAELMRAQQEKILQAYGEELDGAIDDLPR